MPRGRKQGGPRKSRNVTSFASDVEMKDAGHTRKEHPKTKAKNASLKLKHEPNRRVRVGKASPLPQPLGTYGSKQKGGGGGADGTDRCRPKANMAQVLASRARNNNRQLSIVSAASTTLSARDAAPWCDKCTSLNRQLHGYLLEILRHGEDAIGEWAYAVGASPDQMECEPAPERIIPEGYRRCSRLHQLCVARTEAEAGTVVPPPPPPSAWTGTAFAPGVHPGQPGQAPGHASAVMSPYSQQPGTRSDCAQRAHEPVSAPAGGAIQARHALVAIPKHADSCAQRTGPPSQAPLPVPQLLQPPWDGGFHRPAAMYPDSGPAQNTNYHWASQQRHVPNGQPGYNNYQHVGTVHNPPDLLA